MHGGFCHPDVFSTESGLKQMIICSSDCSCLAASLSTRTKDLITGFFVWRRMNDQCKDGLPPELPHRATNVSKPPEVNRQMFTLALRLEGESSCHFGGGRHMSTPWAHASPSVFTAFSSRLRSISWNNVHLGSFREVRRMLFQNLDLEKITMLGCQKIWKILFQPTCNAVSLELEQQNVTKLKMQGLISRKVKKEKKKKKKKSLSTYFVRNLKSYSCS